ncbi:MAG: TIGR03960 family B12-binding radical SAM protein [Syntrophomonadaceae bacterium]|jgi:radical SAM family uncharacterized protein
MKDLLFRRILPQVEKPSRYTGGEVNMIKKDWNSSLVKMAFAFPDVYEVGMSHIGGKILYGLVNEKSEHLMERVFAPWPDMEDLMRKKKIPLYSLESFKPVVDFDIVGFSLQYELSLTNVLNMLDLAGIPVFAREREDDRFPLIIAGGPVVFNPEPFADFFDAFLIGDGEEVILEFLDCYHETRGLAKQIRLEKMAHIQGVYVPALYSVEYNPDNTFRAIIPSVPGVPAKVRKRVVGDLETAYYPEKPIVPFLNIVHDRAVLEVMRGCQRGCRFCHAGIVYRPVRERSVDKLKSQAQAQLCHTGVEEISLASLSTLDYSGVERLVKDLVTENAEKGIGVSLPSLRVDAFSIDLANEVQKVRKTTLTLAPEAGTQRLRDIINKNVSEEQLVKAVEAAFKSGWLSIKLYFMFGLPGESEEDLEGILSLLERVKKIGDQYSKRPVEIRASLACFVPKPHTPFQWHAQNSIEELDNKKHFLQQKRMKRIKISFHDSRTSYLEGVIARGDRKIAQVIHAAWKRGCKFDGWSEYFRFADWMEAFKESGIDPDFYSTRKRSYDEKFPWDFIDIGVNKSFLIKENEAAQKGITTPDCRQDQCTGCGICPSFGLEIKLQEEKANAAES